MSFPGEGYIRAMEVETRYVKGGDKRKLTEKLSDYKTEFRETNQMFTKAKFEAEWLHEEGATGARQLLNANSKLDKSTATLQQSRLLVDETEKIGSATLSDLENQREIGRCWWKGEGNEIICRRGMSDT